MYICIAFLYFHIYTYIYTASTTSCQNDYVFTRILEIYQVFVGQIKTFQYSKLYTQQKYYSGKTGSISFF